MISRLRFLTVGCIVPFAAACAGSQPAGLDGEAVRQLLISGFEQNKAHDVDVARAIPDSALRWAPNDEVRDFAEQVEHTANMLWLAGYTLGETPASVGDTAVYLNDKEALATAVTQWYDTVIAGIRSIPAQGLLEEVDFFGGQRSQRWRIYLFGLQHALWTRGQLVPYFRAHGLVPPAFRAF